MTELDRTQKWDKVFPESDKIEHRKITFHKGHHAGGRPLYAKYT